MSRRKRRAFTPEFKADAVALVQRSGKSIGQVAKELDQTETALIREWVRRAEGNAPRRRAEALSEEEREELFRLRRENHRLTQEREFLEESSFFAKDS